MLYEVIIPFPTALDSREIGPKAYVLSPSGPFLHHLILSEEVESFLRYIFSQTGLGLFDKRQQILPLEAFCEDSSYIKL